MKTRRSTKLFATVAAASLVLAACGGDDDDSGSEGTAESTAEQTSEATEEMSEEATEEMSEEATEEMSEEATGEDTGDGGAVAPSGDAIAYGNAQEFSNYNNNLASSNSVKNTIVINEVLPDTFFFAGPTGDLVMDEELLVSATAVSDDPQVIEYVVNPDAVWSDGDPIDCDDFYFYWAAFNGSQLVLDENGEPVIDEESESEVQLFEITGTTGFDVIDSVECSDDGKTITTSYNEIYADWRATFTNMLPAHIIAQQAGVDDLIGAFESGDRAAIEAMAEFFNTGWSLNPGELKPEIMPSGDKMIIDSWEAGASLTLVPNANYWGTQANGPVTIRYIAEEAQAQALANGEINAMDPQPSPDLLAQLEAIDGVQVDTGAQFIWEHFDFNFNYEPFANRQVREAFALCLPRQQMVSNLIVPLDPTAEILNNRYNQPFESGYVDNSGGLYQEVDIARAQQLLDESGVAQPIDVRIGWFDNGGNQRRTDQVALTVESCNAVEGFNIIDNGSETFFDVELSAGDWDVAMFAWAGSPLKSGSSEIYRTDGGINFGGYGNPEVDALLDALNQELDAAAQVDISNQIDVLLWEDLVTIPVFSFPGVAAYSDNASNVIYNPSQNGLTWNASTWQLS